MPSVISISNLSKTYASGLQALKSIHLEIDSELTDGRKLLVWTEPAGGDGRPDAVLQLRVERRRMPVVNREQRGHSGPSVLEH